MTERKEPKHAFLWFVELLSLFSAGAFIFAGLMNGVAFWTAFSINYFALVSPADIIINGFSTFLITLMIFMGIVWLMLTVSITWYVTQMAVQSWSSSRSGGVGSQIGDPFLVARMIWKGLRRKEFLPYIIAICLLQYMFQTLGLGHDHVVDTNRQYIGLFTQETGLVVANRPADDPCLGAHVAWMGTSSAVLECRDGLRVLHNLEGLETTQRFPTARYSGRANTPNSARQTAR